MMLVDRERSLLLRTHCFPMLTILSLFCQCSNGANISNTTIHFNTCNPTPKNVGIKLRGQEKVCLLFTSISCASLLYLMPLFHYCFFAAKLPITMACITLSFCGAPRNGAVQGNTSLDYTTRMRRANSSH